MDAFDREGMVHVTAQPVRSSFDICQSEHIGLVGICNTLGALCESVGLAQQSFRLCRALNRKFYLSMRRASLFLGKAYLLFGSLTFFLSRAACPFRVPRVPPGERASQNRQHCRCG
ncbi:hypothetical protein [Devriesea agamarum]|uniref:hypothetical protein n=1 Tax=Devriesea agamarum TaxID=472569 RepID=UPI0012EE1CA4|nr:hypothetical protein [Devriesea agamarum]